MSQEKLIANNGYAKVLGGNRGVLWDLRGLCKVVNLKTLGFGD